MKYTRDQHREFVDEIKEHGVNLTTWEEDFVASIEGQLAAGGLSEKQEEILDRIYAERTP